jgi:hypothetical protein
VAWDLALTLLTGRGGDWRLHSPSHWSERYGLVVILALGESVVAIGVGASDLPVSVPVIAGAVLCVALAPFALAFGAGVQMAVERSGSGAGWALGAATAVLSSLLWYGWGLFRSPSGEASRETTPDEESETPLKDRIEEVLMEARMVLPGAQALLGFQVTVTLMNAFDGLDQALKDVHLAALGMTSLSLMLLLAPAAYHRIVERGRNSEEFDRIAGRFLLAAMATLAVGLSCDVVVVVSRVTGSQVAGIGTGAFVLAAAWGLWFGLTSWKAATRKS